MKRPGMIIANGKIIGGEHVSMGKGKCDDKNKVMVMF